MLYSASLALPCLRPPIVASIEHFQRHPEVTRYGDLLFLFDLAVKNNESPTRVPVAHVLDDRFHESCHKRGIHLSSQTPISAVGGLETKDEKEWQRGGGRLKCRLEMRTSRT